jgi:RNA polymerase sigma-70 factor (ECF subfamily)
MTRATADRLADEELMIFVQEGDSGALEVLYDRHGGAAYSLAHRIAGDSQAAEDVTQDAFLSVWRTSAGYDAARGSVRSWLLQIVRNRAIDALRRSAARGGRLDLDDDGLLEAQQAPEQTDAEASRRERARQVRGALRDLPRDQVQVIGLAYFGGFTHSEIAELLGMPLGTVKGRMRLGLQKVRANLGEQIACEHDHRQWEDDIAAYALGALDESETARLELHLAGCQPCRADLRWLAPAVDVLPASVEQVAPPPDLRGRIVAAVAGDRDHEGFLTPSRPQPSGRWSLRRLASPRLALAGAAAIVALVAGLAGGYALRGDDDGPSSAATTFPARVLAPGSTATASLLRSGDSWTLDVRDMPAPPDGAVYQVWLRHDRRMVPSVLFVPSRDRHARVVLPARVSQADEVLVTREPSGGSSAPTSGPMLAAETS